MWYIPPSQQLWRQLFPGHGNHYMTEVKINPKEEELSWRLDSISIWYFYLNRIFHYTWSFDSLHALCMRILINLSEGMNGCLHPTLHAMPAHTWMGPVAYMSSGFKDIVTALPTIQRSTAPTPTGAHLGFCQAESTYWQCRSGCLRDQQILYTFFRANIAMASQISVVMDLNWQFSVFYFLWHFKDF